MPRAADVVVVGGGASGLAAAVAAAEAGAHVVALERDVAFGRRLLATGNGRCNLANARLAWGRYNDAAFVEAVCGTPEGFLADVLAFFEGCGLAVAEEGGGRIYPLSRQASSVREVLLARARRAGVVMAAAREVTGIAQGEVSFDEDGRRISVSAGAVVVAAGGGEGLVRGLGLACAPYEPVLCSLACRPATPEVDLRALDGRRAHVVARLLREGAEVAREEGEALFRTYGVSGIVAFDLSRHARPGDVVSLDLTCGMDERRAGELVRAAGGACGLLDPVVAAALGPDAARRARALRLVVIDFDIANRQAVASFGKKVQFCRYARFMQCGIQQDGIFHRHAIICRRRPDKGRRRGGTNLVFERIILFYYIFAAKVLIGTAR